MVVQALLFPYKSNVKQHLLRQTQPPPLLRLTPLPLPLTPQLSCPPSTFPRPSPIPGDAAAAAAAAGGAAAAAAAAATHQRQEAQEAAEGGGVATEASNTGVAGADARS